MAPSVALWTPLGRGAVATIRVQADLATLFGQHDQPFPFRAANQKAFATQPLKRIVFGYWGADPSEEVVICRLSDLEFEIHCHGGLAAARRILSDLEALQLSVVDWDIQIRQSEGNLTADCQLALTKATTLKTASILLDQAEAWRDFAASMTTAAIAGRWSDLSVEIDQALSWQVVGEHLWQPFRVVLTGPPNVGKSALLNALVGYQRSVVFDQPGTTRDVVTAETAFEGWPVRLIDTAGLRDNALGLEAAGIELAHAEIADADLILQVIDATQPEESIAATSHTLAAKTINIANKIDLLPAALRADLPSPSTVGVSAQTGSGIEHLIANIAAKLVPASPAPGTLVPFREAQITWLRELADAVERQSFQDVHTICDQIIN